MRIFINIIVCRLRSSCGVNKLKLNSMKPALVLGSLLSVATSNVLANDQYYWPEKYTSVGIEAAFNYIAEGEDLAASDNIDNYPDLGLTLTRQFSPIFSVFLQGSYGEGDTTVTEEEVTITRAQLSARVHTSEYRFLGFRPVAGVGYSYTDYEVEATGFENDEDAVYIEGGIQKLLSERIMAEVGGRTYFELEDDFADGQLYAGLNILFGAQYKEPEKIERQPEPIIVAAPLVDSDGDGVVDELDKCPNTPEGALVDSDGCPKELTTVIRESLYVEFDTNKTVVKESSYGEIERVATVMRQYPSAVITLEGHTDSIGSSAYNMRLSEGRAAAVKRVLIEKFEINADRITSVGMGETRPIASNDTADGRARNRRVEAIVSGEYSEIIKK